MAADTGIEPVSLALTGRCITLMLIRKIKWSGIRESNPFPQLGRLVPGRSANPAQDNRIVKEQPVVGYRGLGARGLFPLVFLAPAWHRGPRASVDGNT
jgi:hypothetical protein